MLNFSGDVVWVTGSASGIGRAVAREFAKFGADIVVHGLNQREASETLSNEIQAMGRTSLVVDGDLTKAAIVDDMVKQIGQEFGQLSVLVNCAGGSPVKAMFDELSEADWDFLIDMNLKSVFLATRAALPLLRASDKKGCIVNVSSSVTRSGGILGGIGYISAKGGVDAFTRALAKELAPEYIRVNTVWPGLVDSPFHAVDPNENYRHLVERIPLGRIGQPEDLAGAILFLASTYADYITGEIIEVSGGAHLR